MCNLLSGAFVPIPTRSVLASANKRFASPLPSTLKSTSAEGSLNTAPALTVSVPPSVVAPATVSVLLSSRSANASNTAAPEPTPSVKTAATLPLPIVMLAPEP